MRSFPRRRESSNIKKLDPRLRGDDRLAQLVFFRNSNRMNVKEKIDRLGFSAFFNELRKTHVSNNADFLERRTRLKIEEANHGDFSGWLDILAEMPEVKPSRVDLNRSALQIGDANDLSTEQNGILRSSLKKLHPWRKGPFELFGNLIDAEWRSDLKWARVANAIQPLQGRTVLDLGCGNGYYLWRMAGAGAKLALGADPSLHYAVQFQVFQKYVNDSRLAVLPLGLEDLPLNLTGFDTVFSMGLLYHRRDPMEHLKQLLSFVRKGGELVLETLVIDGKAGDLLKPGERYAKMRNVWNIPATGTAEKWLAEAGFQNIRCADVSVTTLDEQRKTAWMTFESMDDFLDPKDFSKTVEGHPAPKRAIFIAQK